MLYFYFFSISRYIAAIIAYKNSATFTIPRFTGPSIAFLPVKEKSYVDDSGYLENFSWEKKIVVAAQTTSGTLASYRTLTQSIETRNILSVSVPHFESLVTRTLTRTSNQLARFLCPSPLTFLYYQLARKWCPTVEPCKRGDSNRSQRLNSPSALTIIHSKVVFFFRRNGYHFEAIVSQ